MLKKTTLTVDAEQLELFRRLIFKHGSAGVIPIRAFVDDATAPSCGHMLLSSDIGKVAQWAQTVADREGPWVFCPPLVVTNPPPGESWRAREQDVAQAFCLSVEIDDTPKASLARLIQLLGKPTVLVESGGITKDGEAKLHAHWRLAVPAEGSAALANLKWARRLAQQISGADASNIPSVHPIRWPGSIHKKGEPRLCRIVEYDDGVDIDLQSALRTLQEAAPSVQRPTAFTPSATAQKAPSDALAVDLMQRLDNRDLDWESWNLIGLQLFASTAGSEAGLEAWRQFSDKSAKNNPRATESRWEHYYRSPPTQTGWHALRARVPGYLGPDSAIQKLRELVAKPESESETPNIESMLRQALAEIDPDDHARAIAMIEAAYEDSFFLPAYAAELRQEHVRKLDKDEGEPFKPKALVSAEDILNYDPGPICWVIHEAITEGLTMFVGAMKTGKSFLLLQMVESVTTGQPFLGKAVKRGKVLYYGIEDGSKRIARRIRQMGLKPNGANLKFRFDAAPNPSALLAMIEEDLNKHPDTLMVIIDTLKIAMGARPETRLNAYESDVEMLRPFVQLAHLYGVAIVATAHERKPKPGSKGEIDPFNSISGSAGIPATADGLLRLTRIRKERVASLYIGGRDVTDEQEVKLRQDADKGGRFTAADEILTAFLERMALLRSGCPKDIQEFLTECENYTAPRDELRVRMKLRGHHPDTIKKALQRLMDDGTVTDSEGEITLIPPSKNTT